MGSPSVLGESFGPIDDDKMEVEILEEDLRLKENEHGPDSVECVPTLTSLASVLGSLGHLQPQKEILERTLRIVQNYYGSEHLKAAEILVDLGTLHGKL